MLQCACVLVVGDKRKHFRKSSVEQICSDSSIKAAAADYATFFPGFHYSVEPCSWPVASLKSGTMRKEKDISVHCEERWSFLLCLPAITFDFVAAIATMSFLKTFLLCEQLLLGCSSNVVSQIESIQKLTSASAPGQTSF